MLALMLPTRSIGVTPSNLTAPIASSFGIALRLYSPRPFSDALPWEGLVQSKQGSEFKRRERDERPDAPGVGLFPLECTADLRPNKWWFAGIRTWIGEIAHLLFLSFTSLDGRLPWPAQSRLVATKSGTRASKDPVPSPSDSESGILITAARESAF